MRGCLSVWGLLPASPFLSPPLQHGQNRRQLALHLCVCSFIRQTSGECLWEMLITGAPNASTVKLQIAWARNKKWALSRGGQQQNLVSGTRNHSSFSLASPRAPKWLLSTSPQVHIPGRRKRKTGKRCAHCSPPLGCAVPASLAGQTRPSARSG